MKLPVPPRSLMVFLSKLKVFWREWDVQTMVLTSFAMQLILILVTAFRKQTSNQIVVVSIWLVYLLADWVAAQGIGLIARPCGSMTSAEAGSAELYAFWGQFLLLHLGGPDTITALALEDNELWLRTGLHLGVQVYGSLGVLLKSIAQYGGNLWVPTILMFMAGILKYLERVASLFHGRFVKFCHKQHLQKLDKSNYDPDSILCHDPSTLTNVDKVRSAYCLFHRSIGLYVDEPAYYKNGTTRRAHFTNTDSFEEAFRQVEMQLNFAYDSFYTKTVIIHTSRSWKVLRFLVASLLVGCLAIWLFFTNKQGFLHYNVQITYTLLIGAIIAELLAFVRFQLSNWAIGQSEKASRIKILFYEIFLSAYQKRTWGRYWRKKDAPTWPYLRRLFFRRWSESISQLNMISMCTDKPRPDNVQKVIDFFELKNVLDKRKYVSHKWFSDPLRSFIFEDMKQICNIDYCTSRNLGYSKGGMALIRFRAKVKVNDDAPNTSKKYFDATLKLFNIHWEHDVILMWWHIITEICYVTHVKSKGGNANTGTQLEEDNPKVEDYREICKTLSDYLFSLLIHQPEMMHTVAATEERLRKLKDELRARGVSVKKRLEFCKCLREESTQQRYNHVDGTTVQFPINKIITELEELEKDQGELVKWKLMAEIWAELLYCAALHCKPRVHVAKLKQGGELLSVVWMLLLDFGYGLEETAESQRKAAETNDHPERALLYRYFDQQK